MDTMEIGSGPAEEDCASVGSRIYDYETMAKLECTAFIAALKIKYGDLPEGARLKTKSNPHDMGSYYDVVCVFDPAKPDACAYALSVEKGMSLWEEVDFWPPVVYGGGAARALTDEKLWSRKTNPNCYTADDPRWQETIPTVSSGIHPSVTIDRVKAVLQDSLEDLEYPGFCLACGVSVSGVEPDARDYKCESCESHRVYGAEEVAMMMA